MPLESKDQIQESFAAQQAAPRKVGSSNNEISMEIEGSIEKAITTKSIETSYSVTGRGYNLLTAPYWSGKNVARGYILDFTGLSGARTEAPVNETHFTVVTEKSRSKLANAFAQHSSGEFKYGWFSASFSQNMEKASEVSTEKAYTKIMVEYLGIKESLTMENLTTEKLEDHLLKGFEKDLNDRTLKPEELFDKYGTHVIMQAYYGGIMDVLGTTEIRASDTMEKIQGDINTSVNGNSVSGGASSEKKSSKEQRIVNIKGDYSGGVGRVPNSLVDFAEKANDWLTSLANKDSWSFCGVPKDTGSLKPIWELTEDEDRKKELHDYFEMKLGESKGCLEDYESYITDIKMVWGKTKEEAQILAGNWERDHNYKFDKERDHDLNYHMGDGTGYIFIGYKRETREQLKKSKKMPITNLFILDIGEFSTIGMELVKKKNINAFYKEWEKRNGGKVKLGGYDDVSYSRVGTGSSMDDINNLCQGAHGLMYLCYTTDIRFTPLTALGVYNRDVGEFDAYHKCIDWIELPSWGSFASQTPRSVNYKKSEGVYLVYKRAEKSFDPTRTEE